MKAPAPPSKLGIMTGFAFVAALAACKSPSTPTKTAPASDPNPPGPVLAPASIPSPAAPVETPPTEAEQWRALLASTIFNPRDNCRPNESVRAFTGALANGNQLVFLLTPAYATGAQPNQLRAFMTARLLEITPSPESQVVRVSRGDVRFEPGPWKTMQAADATALTGLSARLKFNDLGSKTFSLVSSEGPEAERREGLEQTSFQFKDFPRDSIVHEYLCSRASLFGAFDDMIADEAIFGTGSVARFFNTLQSFPVTVSLPDGGSLQISLKLKLNSNGTYEFASTIHTSRRSSEARRWINGVTGAFKVEDDLLYLAGLGVLKREGDVARALSLEPLTLVTEGHPPARVEPNDPVTFDGALSSELVARLKANQQGEAK